MSLTTCASNSGVWSWLGVKPLPPDKASAMFPETDGLTFGGSALAGSLAGSFGGSAMARSTSCSTSRSNASRSSDPPSTSSATGAGSHAREVSATEDPDAVDMSPLVVVSEGGAVMWAHGRYKFTVILDPRSYCLSYLFKTIPPPKKMYSTKLIARHNDIIPIHTVEFCSQFELL